MSQIVSFEDYTPPARFDDTPWSEVRIEQSDNSTLSDATVWTQIDVIALSPLDADPSDPASRSFTTDQASDTPNLWYRITFADGLGNVSLTSTPVQNAEFMVTPYATVDELFRILKVGSLNNPASDAQIAAAQGDLETATIEINTEIDLSDDHPPLTPEELAVCKGVCIDRAADLWRHRESMPGVMGITDESVPTISGRYSFARYNARLSPLKDQWGVA